MPSKHFLRKEGVLSNPHACCYYNSCRRQELYVLKTLDGFFLSYEKTGCCDTLKHFLREEGVVSCPHAFMQETKTYDVLQMVEVFYEKKGTCRTLMHLVPTK